MSDFEFLRNINIGQYLPTGSVIHRLDARARIIIFSFFILALTFSPRLPGILMGLGMAILGLIIARIPLRYTLRSLAAPLPFLLILALLQVLFTRNPQSDAVLWEYWLIRITPAGLLSGLLLILRFIALIMALSLASFTLSSSDLIQGLNSLFKPLARLGLPIQDLIMMIQVALRFLPLLALTAERTAKAQASRGADWGTGKGGFLQRVRRVVPLILPLFLASLQKAENMSQAMDSRGYGVSKVRSEMYEMKFNWVDALVMIAAPVYFATMFIV